MRPSWDEYFMNMAFLVSSRATCDRRNVGAVLVKDRRIIATGYNGSPVGSPHCDDVGHLLKEIDGRKSCIRTLHAESNALDFAGREAVGCTAFVTDHPCYECAKRLISAGIDTVVYGRFYKSQATDEAVKLLEEAGVPTRDYSKVFLQDLNSLY